MINIRDGKRGGIYGSEKNPREEECFDKSEETIKRKQMCETDKGGKIVATFTWNGMLQGSDLPPFSANAAVGFWLRLPTYLPRLIARLVQVSRTRKGFVLRGYPFPIPPSSISRSSRSEIRELLEDASAYPLLSGPKDFD